MHKTLPTAVPIIAAIPNYNMSKQLATLLPQVIRQGYEAIYVLDDVSTDDSHEVVKDFAKEVTWVAGDRNLGAGGNRNRILDVLPNTAIIHFIDADASIEGTGLAQAVRNVVPDHEFGFIGGLAKTSDGTQNIWNYGPQPGLRNEIGALRQFQLGNKFSTNPNEARVFRQKHAALLSDWPNPFETPTTRQVFWCIEQNLIVRSDIFKRFSGFNEKIRETEILELAYRMQRAGLPSYFNPSVITTHAQVDVRTYNRDVKKRKEIIQMIFRFGFWKWLRS